ncbi:helix-turn-helix domain-containing protein [Nonomuraea sp. KM90]|uniref:helix-turn-helix domain-containing protein n=1 Tax=Nonomuraea sp. KM90 TaxID=3457428 RepID=UPI003FCE6E61
MPTLKHTRTVGAERVALAKAVQKRYVAGESVREIATSLGRSYGFIHRLLADIGTTFRGRGGGNRRRGNNRSRA